MPKLTVWRKPLTDIIKLQFRRAVALTERFLDAYDYTYRGFHEKKVPSATERLKKKQVLALSVI